MHSQQNIKSRGDVDSLSVGDADEQLLNI